MPSRSKTREELREEEQKWVDFYNAEVKELLESQKKYDDEEFVQCLDYDSFNGTMYKPYWIISNHARCFSMAKVKMDFIEADQNSSDGRYSYKNGSKNVKVHKLVANYFCDKAAVEKHGEEHVDVDHTPQFDRNKSNEENNYYKHLSWIYSKTHDELVTRLERGEFKNGNEVHYSSDDDGVPTEFGVVGRIIDLRKGQITDVTLADMGGADFKYEEGKNGSTVTASMKLDTEKK